MLLSFFLVAALPRQVLRVSMVSIYTVYHLANNSLCYFFMRPKWLYRESEQAGKDQQQKYSVRTTRRTELRRAHGLIRKIPRGNRSALTEKGQNFSCTLMTTSANALNKHNLMRGQKKSRASYSGVAEVEERYLMTSVN